MKHIFVETEENRKRYIKQEHRFIGVAIATIYGFYVLSTNIGYILRKLDTRDSVADMKTSISSNSNINEEEKEYLNGIDVFLNDYEKYIDIPFACEKLENFDILYKDCEDKGSVITKGIWSKSKGKITYYITDDESEELRKKTINHELLHLISSHDGYYPGILNEGITSVICYEYDLSTDYCYDKYRLITYMLCEIVSSDTVIESYLKSDFSLIEKKLYEIIPDKSLTRKLVDSFENCTKYNNCIMNVLGIELGEKEQQEFKENEEKLCKSIDEISNILCKYYITKTGKLIGDSKVVNAIYNLHEGYDEYDLKMSIYNSELNKNNLYSSDKFDGNTGKLTSTKEKEDRFDATTDYFNKRNKDKVHFFSEYYNEKWGFKFNPENGILESYLVGIKKSKDWKELADMAKWNMEWVERKNEEREKKDKIYEKKL